MPPMEQIFITPDRISTATDKIFIGTNLSLDWFAVLMMFDIDAVPAAPF